jgi:hypothetical protein
VAVVQNFSRGTANDQVVFSAGAQRIGAVPVTIVPGGSAEARVPLDRVASGGLSAAISDRDGYAVDNMRYAVVGGEGAVSVLAVTGGGNAAETLYVERALAVAEGTRAFRFRSISGVAFSAQDSRALEGVDVVLVLSTRGIAQRGRERLAEFTRGGGGLLISAGPDVDPAILKQALDGVVLTSFVPRAPAALTFAPDDSRHPVFRLFGGAGTLGNVDFARSARLTPAAAAIVIARYSDGSAAVVEERTQEGRVLLFASDLNNRWNDFPLQPAFVPFLHEAVRYLAASRSSRTEFLVGELPGVAEPGVVTVSSRLVAVNVNPRESDPARMTSETFQAGIARLNATAVRNQQTAARREEDHQFLWWYGLLLMFVSVAAEGVVGRRLG